MIRPADEGRGAVVMIRSDYIKQAPRQVSDNRFYQQVPNNVTLHFTNRINDALAELHDSNKIGTDQFNYLRYFFVPHRHYYASVGTHM